MSKRNDDEASVAIDLTLVMPCYNEDKCLERTVPPLVEVFQKAGIALQLVLVDNGSHDSTSAMIDHLIERGLPITKGMVAVNHGFGFGVLTGHKLARGRYIGVVCADGQVAPESVLTIYRALAASSGVAMAKARRRFRQDSWLRKIISVFYNVGMLLIFPGMPSIDVNGNPKILPAEIVRMMELTSRDWFLDAEIMLKARHLRLLVYEIDVPGFRRTAGGSSIHAATLFEFARNILKYRLGRTSREWRNQVMSVNYNRPVPATAPRSD